MSKESFWHVALAAKPDLTRGEFNEMWNRFQELKRMKAIHLVKG